MLSYLERYCIQKGIMKRVLRVDFIRFCIVGTMGFILNFLLLTLLYKILDLPIFFAQLLAAEIALFNNFLLHHHWTYKRNNVIKNFKDLLWQFHLTSWVAIVGSALLISFFTHGLNFNYVIALACSSLIALSWNYFWTKHVIWRHQHDQKGVTQ